MIINITQHCSLRCPHCMQNAGPERNERMTQSTFEQALKFAKQIGSNVVMLSGGEPTTHPLFFNFLEMLLHQGFVSTAVLSNGTFLKDHKFTERLAKMVEHESGFFIQISSFKGLYANYEDVHKPGLKALRMFGKKAMICDDPNDIRMKPLGRACSGKWYEEVKRIKGFPSCTNSCLILTQTKSSLIGQLMESHQRFCLPIVSWDGSVRLGESEQCKVIANIAEPLEDINKKLLSFKPCGGCASYKWRLENPVTEQEKTVHNIFWPTNSI